MDNEKELSEVDKVENKDIVALLRSVSVSDRQEIFSHFCTECGGDDPVCYCTRDD